MIAAAVVIVVTVAISAASAGTYFKALLIFGAVFLCVWLLVSERYELTLAVLVLYLGLLDGYVKLRLNTSWATLGRDALLYAIVAGALIRAAVRRKRIHLPPLTGWVLAFSAVVLIQVFNPASGSWSHALASVRPHLEFVPLFFLGYWTMRSKTRLRGFLLLLLAIAAINGVVSFVQFNLTPTQFAGWGPGYGRLIYGTGSVSGRAFIDSSGVLHTRPFGLGGDAGFGGIVGMLAVPAALAFVLMRARARPLVMGVTIALAAGAIAGVITSQARVAVVSSVLATLAFGILASVSRRVIGTLVALTVAFAVTLATVSIVTGNSQTPFRRYKTITPDRVLTTTYEYRRGTLGLVPDYATSFPLGAGIGSAGPAGGYGGQTRGSGLNAESEPTYLLIELGIPGLLVLLALNLKLFALALRRIHRLADIELRLILAALVAPLFAIFAGWVVGIATASNPTAPYFWFVAGVAAFWLGENRTPRAVRAVAARPARPRRPRGAHRPARAVTHKRGRRVPVDRPPTRVPAPRQGSRAGMKISVLYRDTSVRVDGIRDYSERLCDSLNAGEAKASLALSGESMLPREVERSDALVVQYNPFSYGRRGFAPWLPAALSKLKRARPRPMIAVMVHEPFMPMSGVRASLMGGWQRHQLAELRRAVDVTFVSIQPWVETVRKRGPKGPVHHLPVGSNVPDMRHHREAARAELGLTDETIVLGAFGTAHPSRLLSHIGESARALHEAGRSAVLLNLGDGAAVPERLPPSVRVISPGFLEAAELARRLSAVDIFLAPFVDGVSSRRATFVAALQHGLPIAATDGPLTDRFLREATGAFWLAPVDRSGRLAEAVVSLARHPSQRDRLGHGARRLYEREFAWPVVADRVVVHLREVFLANLSNSG